VHLNFKFKIKKNVTDKYLVGVEDQYRGGEGEGLLEEPVLVELVQVLHKQLFYYMCISPGHRHYN
jgi:hypothetical protein